MAKTITPEMQYVIPTQEETLLISTPDAIRAIAERKVPEGLYIIYSDAKGFRNKISMLDNFDIESIYDLIRKPDTFAIVLSNREEEDDPFVLVKLPETEDEHRIEEWISYAVKGLGLPPENTTLTPVDHLEGSFIVQANIKSA